ncbi:guanine nucleotide binding protein, alpha subunit [Mrakia frigida]|uniref:guanine nucleotide-binding protein subunit alpha n=1 Tax=Mrakia frigida TaxID=29902 RepID=UPI003FCBFE93
MGACFSSPSALNDDSHTRSSDAARSHSIEKGLRLEEQANKQIYKLLLLGAGESGKSTILKLVVQRDLLWDNILSAFGLILECMEEWEIKAEERNESSRTLVDQAGRDFITLLSSSSSSNRFAPELRQPLVDLWNDDGIKLAWKRGKERCFPENLPYLMDAQNMERFWREGYLPSSQDILRIRSKTVGVSETAFKIGGNTFNIIDVGGQRSERRKWIHVFEGVNGLIFVVSLVGYDTCLVEDETANQMQEALLLYSQISNSIHFSNSYQILFLNKLDLFQTKILLLQSPIKTYFPDFTGAEGDVEKSVLFFRKKFLRLFRGRTAGGGGVDGGEKSREIYVHETTAVDPKIMKFVMLATTNVILRSRLENLGLL